MEFWKPVLYLSNKMKEEGKFLTNILEFIYWSGSFHIPYSLNVDQKYYGMGWSRAELTICHINLNLQNKM